MLNGPTSAYAGPSRITAETPPPTTVFPQTSPYHQPNQYHISSPSAQQQPGPFHPYYASHWSTSWPTYPHSTGSYTSHQHVFSQYAGPLKDHAAPQTIGQYDSPRPKTPAYPKYWDGVLRSFLEKMKLTQALRGLESDMLIMNSDWERDNVGPALRDLADSLLHLYETDVSKNDQLNTHKTLDDRKLDYVHLEKGCTPQSHTSVSPADHQGCLMPSRSKTVREISTFLARNKERNSTSNRIEFLHSPKKRRVNDSDDNKSLDPPTCARTQAKSLDRARQMGYDIAKNEDGPLRRTVKDLVQLDSHRDGSQSPQTADNSKSSPGEDAGRIKQGVCHDPDSVYQHPGLEERLRNIESHLAVRYVPCPPRGLLSRLKFLEDHIVKLEKEYPPWAALHFNQPNRGWPPPPRSTPIIVPPYLRQTPQDTKGDRDSHDRGSDSLSELKNNTQTKIRNSSSSLHRAVLERLEVQHAMKELQKRTYVQASLNVEQPVEGGYHEVLVSGGPLLDVSKTEAFSESPKKKQKRSKKSKTSDIAPVQARQNVEEVDMTSNATANLDIDVQAVPQEAPPQRSARQKRRDREKRERERRLKALHSAKTLSGNMSEIRRLKRIAERQANTTCFACREKGHCAKDCPVVKKKSGDNIQSNSVVGHCYRCGSTRHTLARCKKSVNEGDPLPFASCFVCSGQGHLASNCPQNQSKGIYPNGGCCKLCGNTSHLARNCSLRTNDAPTKPTIFGTGQGAEADEDDFHTYQRRKSEVARDEKRENHGRRIASTQVGAHSGQVKAFGKITNMKPKKVVYF